MTKDLTRVETHFAFGRNWASFADRITEVEIEEAVVGLQRLVGALNGKRFLDIGCGSGLHALAALRLGAREVVAVDLDQNSVLTARRVLAHHAPGHVWQVDKISVFDLSLDAMGAFDTVYAWGVLHHTGDMQRAIRQAAALPAPGGIFAFALYRRVWMDWFWRREKPWYARASSRAQARARTVYMALFRLGLRLTGRSFADYLAGYRSNRGMDYSHDVHDWLGGWPYESILPKEVEALMRPLRFEQVQSFTRKGWLFGREFGFFGSGCDEYVYRRSSALCAA